MNSPLSKSFIPLILITLTLSLGAVALIVNGALTMPTAQEISSLCSEAVQTTVSPSTCLPPVGIEGVEQNSLSPSMNNPGFTYPNAWNIAQIDIVTEGKNAHVFVADTAIPTYCETCQRNAPLVITTQPFPPAYLSEDADIFVFQQYAASEDAIITKEPISFNNTEYLRYRIVGTTPKPEAQPFTDIIFLGTSSWSHVMITSTKTFTPTAQTIQAITDSLDFSLIP
jgi:hypothetical protein